MSTPSGIECSLEELLQYQQCVTRKLPPKRLAPEQSGQYVSNFRGRGMDFSEVRCYQAGDDIRHMEWRVTARSGEPHIKLYHEERERPVFVVADYNPSMFFGTRVAYKSVIVSRFSAMIGFAAAYHGDRVGGMVFSGDDICDIRPRARKQGVLPLVKNLSHFSSSIPQKSCALDNVLGQLRQVVKPGALVFILSDFEELGDNFEAYMQRLCRHTDVICYLVSDPLERQAPEPGRYAITDGINDMLLNTAKQSTCQLFQEHYQQKKQQLQKCIKPGRLVELSTDDNLEQHIDLAFASFHDWSRI